MANPIHMLKQGMLLKNWSLIKMAYSMLTGEDVETGQSCGVTEVEIPQKKKRGRPRKQPVEEAIADDQDAIQLETETAIENEEPEEDNILAQKIANRKRNRDNIEVVTADEVDEQTAGKQAARSVGPVKFQKNIFQDKDNLLSPGMKEACKLKISKKVIAEAKANEVKRPPVKFVKVVCSRCSKKETVHPSLIRRIEGTPVSYICNGCQTNGARGTAGV